MTLTLTYVDIFFVNECLGEKKVFGNLDYQKKKKKTKKRSLTERGDDTFKNSFKTRDELWLEGFLKYSKSSLNMYLYTVTPATSVQEGNLIHR